MGKVIATRADGSVLEVRTTKKTKHVRLAHEKPVAIDLSGIGDTPALTELFLSTETALAGLDLSALANHPALESFRAHVKSGIDLRPLASCPLRSLSIDSDGSEPFDLSPFAGHRTLANVSLSFSGTQSHLDLSFVRTLPALESLSIDGGNWKTLDLEPLRGLPLRSFTLIRQYVSSVDLSILAQPALEHLMLQDLEIREGYFDLLPLSRCTELRFLSLLGNEVGTLEVSGLAKLGKLQRFDPPNFKQMMMSATMEPITSPGLAKWRGNLGID
jgi:hypothetical protein